LTLLSVITVSGLIAVFLFLKLLQNSFICKKEINAEYL